MAESPVATPHLREEAPSPTRSPAAPEVAVPEAATEAAAQALVRALHPGAGGGAAGAPTPPPPSSWTARRSASPRDFVALQRMAGNRAVAGLVARRPMPTLAAAPGAAAPVVQRKPNPTLVEPSLNDIKVNELPPPPAPAFALQYTNDSLDQAAKDFGKDLTIKDDAIIIGLQEKVLVVYDKTGQKRLAGPLEVKLPKGMRPAPGVYMSPSAKDAADHHKSFPVRQIMVDPKANDWVLGGYVAYLKDKDKDDKKAVAAAGGDPAAVPTKTPVTGDPKQFTGDPAGAKVAAGAAAQADAKAGPEANKPKPLPMLDLRQHITNAAEIDRVINAHQTAVQFYLVPEPKGGVGAKKGGGTTGGFSGELQGSGPPPNAPPWPVSMDGPRMQPANSQGSFSARINWAANGNNFQSAQTLSALGTEIHYRWEYFDITQLAKKNEEKLAAEAANTQALLKAAEARGIAIDTPGSTAATSGGAKPAGAGTGAVATQPPMPKSKTDEDEKGYEDQKAALASSKEGSGKDATEGNAGRNFRARFKELKDDTARASRDVSRPTGSTEFERRSNREANLLAMELLPVSFLITGLGATLRLIADGFAGDQDNQEINFEHEGVFLVRVISSPAVATDREGKPVIRPSSVATRVVEVVKMDRMIREGLDEPGAQLAQAELELAQATKSGKEDRIAEAKLALDMKKLEAIGDPREFLTAKAAIKQDELKRAQAKYQGVAVGPIIEIQHEIDLINERIKIFDLQDRRRSAGMATKVPAKRVNAVLVSEVTGQTLPLLLSVGPAQMDGNRHVWKVLDATNEDAEGFTGYGATEREAVRDAFRQFGNKAAYGKGSIGVRIPTSIVPPGKETPADLEFTVPSKPLGWAIAKGRIDDLVMTLAALGLLVASAGTASIAIGALVAAARLADRLYNGTLRFDAAAVSDVLAILGAVGAAAHHAAEVSVAAAGVKFQKIGSSMVMLEEGAQVSASELRAAEQAFEKASGMLSKIEKANEVLNYAGIVWGNVTFFDEMAETAEAEAKGPANGGITHAEARRRRAAGLAGALNNNGMAIAPNALKAVKARKDAKAAGKGSPSEAKGPTGLAEPTPKPDTTRITPEPKPEATDRKAPTGADGPAVTGDHGTAGGEHGSAPTEPVTKPGEPAVKPGEHAPPASRPATEPGAAKDVHPAGAVGAGEHAPAPATSAPKPGSAQERAAAHKTLQDAARGEGDLKAAARDAIGKGGSWKEGLKKALEGLEGDHRAKAEEALVEARDKIVMDEWKKLEAGEYKDLTLENTGTKAFESDIDATVRPKAEATGTGPEIAAQVERAAKAAQALSEALRKSIGGGETDVVIDTNIYSFIGEGRLASVDPNVKAAQGHVDLVAGLAEQMRGQGEAGFKAFEQALGKKLSDPRVGREAKALLGEAREFHGAREAEWSKALAEAGVPPRGKPTPEQARTAREAILGAKKGELGTLLRGEPPNAGDIARKQSEINWFAPDAYATPSAFKQAVAHGQRLKGTARTAAEWKGSEVAAKLRENAGKLGPEEPRAQKMLRDAALVESQGNTLEAIEKDIRSAQDNVPVDLPKLKELEAYADGLRKSIARTAEPLVVAEILGVTNPASEPGPQRLSEAAAASAANMGMLEAHVTHAGDINEQVKAAAKYSGRIAMAEFLSGRRPSADPVARVIADFVKSRWGVMESARPQILRDMFVRYARATGRHTELTYNARGEAIGASDALKQAFVNDVRDWARSSNADLQAAAISSKAFENPSPTPAPPTAAGEPSTKPGTGGDHVPALTGPDTAGGDQTKVEAREHPPTPAAPVPITRAGGVTTIAETPPLNPPGEHRAFAFRIESYAEASATIRRIAEGDTTALSERGVQLPANYKTQGREFGMAALPDGTYAIVQGGVGKVQWTDLPVGSVPLMHTHPLTPERQISKPRTVTELAKQAGTSNDDGPTPGSKDAAHVFPSASDTLFCAANGIRNHDVGTPYVHTGDGVLKNPTGAKGEKAVSFRISDATHAGNIGERPVSESFLTAHDAEGNVLFMSRMWAFEISGDSILAFKPPKMGPAKPETLLRSLPSKAGTVGARPDGPAHGDTTGAAPRPGGASGPGTEGAAGRPQRRGSSFGDWVAVEGLEGGAWIKNDGVATTVRAEADPTALVRIEGKGQSLTLTDIYRQDLAQGTGSRLLAEGLRAVKAGPGTEVLIERILNKETIATYDAGQPALESKLGKTMERALAALGLSPRQMKWEKIGGKLCIAVDIG